MKICHVTNAATWSGGLAQMQLLLEDLEKKGHQNILVCPPDCELVKKLQHLKNLKIVPIKIFQDYDLVSAFKIRQLVKKEKPDIVHAHHAQAHAVALVALLGLKFPALVVSRRVSFSPRKNPFSRWKYLSSRIQKYTVVSDSVKQTLVKSGIDAGKIEVVYSAVHPQNFVAKKTFQDLRKELNIPENYKIVGKIANYALWKGQHIFLKAAQEVLKVCPQTIFVLAGKNTKDCEKIARDLGIENNVRALGFRSDVADLISVFDVSCNAAIEGEGLSGAVRESFWFLVPVVASNVAGNSEIVREGQTGYLVAAADAKNMAQKIVYALTHDQEAKNLAKNGRLWVEQNATLEVMTQKTLSVYQSVLKK